MIPAEIILPAVASETALAAIVTAILSGGAAAGYVALRKAPAEVESISVATMRKAIETQDGVIEELRNELTRKDLQLGEQNRLIGELRHRVEKLEASR